MFDDLMNVLMAGVYVSGDVAFLLMWLLVVAAGVAFVFVFISAGNADAAANDVRLLKAQAGAARIGGLINNPDRVCR